MLKRGLNSLQTETGFIEGKRKQLDGYKVDDSGARASRESQPANVKA